MNVFLEDLEQRKLLSVSLSGTNLLVNGSDTATTLRSIAQPAHSACT